MAEHPTKRPPLVSSNAARAGTPKPSGDPSPMDWEAVSGSMDDSKLPKRSLTLTRRGPAGETRGIPAIPRKVNPAKRGPAKKRARPGLSGVTLGDAASYGLKAWHLAKYLASLVNVETKILDVDGTAGTQLSTTPSVVNLSNIAQGSDYLNRTGDSIKGQFIEFHAYIASSGLVDGHTARVMIVCDKEQRGTDPAVTDVLQSSGVIQPYNALTSQRFEILYDEFIVMNSPGAGLATGGTSTNLIVTRQKLPLLQRAWNKHILYSNTTAADGSNLENGLYLMAFSGSASNGPTLAYTFRLGFTDN